MAIRKRMSTSKKSKQKYTYQVYFDKYHYYKGGFATKAEALQHEREKLVEFEKYGYMTKSINRNMNDVYQEYMAERGDTFQYQTLEMKRKSYKIFGDQYGYVLIKNITKPLLRSFFDSRANESYKTNLEIKKILNCILKYALENEYILVNPLDHVKISGLKRHRNNSDYLPYEDFEALCIALKQKGTYEALCYRTILYVGYYTGLRISEILALDQDDIDFKNHLIHVKKKLVTRGLKKKEFFVDDQLKTEASKSDIIMLEPLEKELKAWMRINRKKRLFCDSEGFYINPGNSSTSVKKVAESLNIKGFHWHMLRHTLSSDLIMNQANIKDAQELMRHTNASTTLDIYTHTTEEKKRETLESVRGSKEK